MFSTNRSLGCARGVALLSLLLAVLLGAASRAQDRRGSAKPGSAGGTAALAELERAFLAPPDEARIMMRWWWFGPTVTKAELEREMRAMKDAGVGGFEVQAAYPVTLDDPARGLVTHPFLSDSFLDHLQFAATKARELGLRADLTLGSGWPYGGPQVGITQAAGKLRIVRVPVPAGASRVAVPDVRAGEQMLAAFVAQPAGVNAFGGPRGPGEMTDGVLRIPDPVPAPRDVLFFVSSRSGMMVKRAAVGGEGFVLDHYDRAAVDAYQKTMGERLLRGFGPVPPYAIFCDSLEVFESDWTPDFLDTFRVKRGYDLRPLLPTLAVDTGSVSAAVRHDWGQTLTELLKERFLAPMQAWAHQHGTRFRLQGYGVPPATISSNADIDLPEGEGSQWKTLRASRWAASVGHLYGRPVISSETWTWLHSPSFMATPLDVKAEADLHFLQGINQLIGHGWPYTDKGAAYPGWRFYAAGAFNDQNPWWLVMPDLGRYLQRLSFLLRQGRPVNDVAIYLPNDDAWAHFVPGKIGTMIDALAQRIGPDIVARVIEAGYNLDFVDDGVLAGRAQMDQGALAIGENRYRAIILPGVERIPAATLRALEQNAAGGLIVMATRRIPTLAPGYLATAADHAAILEGAERLFRGASPRGVFVERESDVAATLSSRIRPDMVVSSGAADLGVVHRRTDAVDLYFVANASNTRRATEATFRVAARRVLQWNPLTGRSAPLPLAGPATRDTSTVTLDLAPYESTVVVFPRDTSPAPPVPVTRSAVVPPPLDLSGGWRVTIGGTGPPSEWTTLRSWTDDDATRYYSGVGVYEKHVTLPPGMMRRDLAIWLDLGTARPLEVGGPRARVQAWVDAPVRDAAIVTVNGRRVGSVWCPPYAIDVTDALRIGDNTVRIDVANLAVNHMAGHALPDYTLLNLRYGVRFEPQDMDKVQPIPSGLFGPIRLVAMPARNVSSLGR